MLDLASLIASNTASIADPLTAVFGAMNQIMVRDGIVMFVGLVVAIGLHEFGHAAAAVWLGDNTPKDPSAMLAGQRVSAMGYFLGAVKRGGGPDNRYTMNPVRHADPIGTVALPLVATFLLPGAMLIGWGRPVPFNPYAARRKISRRAMVILVSLAGPAMNLVQALFFSGVLITLVALGVHKSDVDIVRATVVWTSGLVALNFILMCFNLIPVPPLDGGQILVHYLAEHNREWAAWLEQYGLFIFLLLFPVLPFLLKPVVMGTTAWVKLMVSIAGG